MSLLLAALALPVLLSIVLGVGADRFAVLVPARTAARLLPIAALACAVGTGLALCVLTLFVLARDQLVAALGHWSVAALPDLAMPWPAAAIGVGIVFSLLAAAGHHSAAAGRQLWLASAACRQLAGTDTATGVGPGGVLCWTLVDDDRPDAYAIPGSPGRVVISSGMIATLTGPERRVLLAHENSHLRHRHDLWLQAAHLAAAANPLLRTVPRAVELAAERHADDDAARAVGSAALVARAVGRAALARNQHRAAEVSRGGFARLAATGSDVVRRVRVLLHPASRYEAASASVLLCVVTAAVLTSTATAAHLTEQRFETARHATLVAPGSR